LFGRNESKEQVEKNEGEKDQGKKLGDDEKQGVEAREDINVFEILDDLRSRLKEFSGVLPKLDEKKELLEKHVHQEQEKVAEIESLIPKLEKKKKNLQEDMKRKQEEISRIDEIKLIFSTSLITSDF